MKKLTIATTLCICAFYLFGCNTASQREINDSNIGSTGYWYLGDNDERQWRILTPDEIKTLEPAVRKKYASPFGNGGGR